MHDPLTQKIRKLKEERKAVILAHNYQVPEVQDIADYTGDSLDLSRKAAQTDAEVIVFCGVHFMAETASLLCPDKKILLPDMNAGCPMADMVTPERLIQLKKEHPKATVVCYINTTAAVKAECDICCTSANAVDIIRSLDDSREIIFTPDKFLGQYVTSLTGRKMIYWDGHCHVHLMILPENIIAQKKRFPRAEVLVHPECTPEVTKLADRVLSTNGMCRYAKESSAEELIIGTEVELIYRLKKENPGKRFYPASDLAVCPNMKLNSLEKILWVLEDTGPENEVRVPENIRARAVKSVNEMLRLSK